MYSTVAIANGKLGNHSRPPTSIKASPGLDLAFTNTMRRCTSPTTRANKKLPTTAHWVLMDMNGLTKYLTNRTLSASSEHTPSSITTMAWTSMEVPSLIMRTAADAAEDAKAEDEAHEPRMELPASDDS
eukprot:GDKK01048161.1.p2 GENE.GDKK01048161.1~~GDKK01048161.1.p2  ORF type:complete len:129 (+),score=5.95 GDKK01048161.1:125-511(+)